MLDVKSKTCEHGFSDSERCGKPAVEIDDSGKPLCDEHFKQSRLPAVETVITVMFDIFDQIAAQVRLCNGDVTNACLSVLIQIMIKDHSPEEAKKLIIDGVNNAFQQMAVAEEKAP